MEYILRLTDMSDLTKKTVSNMFLRGDKFNFIQPASYSID